MKTILALATILAATSIASAQPAPTSAPDSTPCYSPCTIQPAAPGQAQPAIAQPQVAALQPPATEPVAAPPTAQPALVNTSDADDNGWRIPVGRRFSHGFRLGWTYVENFDKPTRDGGMSLKQEYGLKSANMMLLGYEGFYRIVGHSWLNVLMVGNVTVAGLEQSKFIPAASGLIGFEFNRSFEIGVGVNLTPDPQSPSHMIAAAGYTPSAGAIQVPIHAFYVPDADGNNRYGATIGMNW